MRFPEVLWYIVVFLFVCLLACLFISPFLAKTICCISCSNQQAAAPTNENAVPGEQKLDAAQRRRKRTVQVTCTVQHRKRSILSCERIPELQRGPSSSERVLPGSVSLKPVVKAGVEQMAVGCVLSDASLAAINS